MLPRTSPACYRKQCRFVFHKEHMVHRSIRGADKGLRIYVPIYEKRCRAGAMRTSPQSSARLIRRCLIMRRWIFGLLLVLPASAQMLPNVRHHRQNARSLSASSTQLRRPSPCCRPSIASLVPGSGADAGLRPQQHHAVAGRRPFQAFEGSPGFPANDGRFPARHALGRALGQMEIRSSLSGLVESPSLSVGTPSLSSKVRCMLLKGVRSPG